MKYLILGALVLILTYPSVSYAEEKTGSLEIGIQYTNGDRVSPSEMVYKVYQDTHNNLFKTIEEPSSNPYYLTSLPLNYKYIVEVYVNDMYSGTGSVDLTTVQTKDLTIKIPLSGGFRFNVFYNDDNTPIEGAAVSIKSYTGNVLRHSTTDDEGLTPRSWLQSTTLESDYYTVSVSMGEHLVYDQSPIRLEPGVRKEVKVVTPWPSHVEQLVVNMYKTPSEKLSESDGKVVAELHHADGKKVESIVNRKGDAFFTNLGVGDYTLHVFREREGFLYNLEEWGSIDVTLASSQLSMKFVRSEPFMSSWQVSKEPYPPFYNRTFSSLISNLGSNPRNATISLIFDRDQTTPYDIVKDLNLSIPAGETKNLQLELSPKDKGTYFTYMVVNDEKSTITDQISWQHAFDVTRVRPLSSNLINPQMNANEQMNSNLLERAPRSCNCAAFRLDDIQDYFTRDAQKDLINMFLEEDAPLTIGVIGGFLHEDKDLIQFLQNAVSSGTIEVANHSWDHKDHSAKTLDEQKDSIVKTNERIEELFGTQANTFIPPENAFNNDTLSVMKEAGLTHLSGSIFVRADTPPYPLKNGDSIFHFPQTAFVSNVNATTGKWEIFSNEQVLEMIRASIKQYGFAVISMHPVAYYDKQDSKYVYHKETMQALHTLLKEVKNEFNIVGISDIDRQGWIPKHPKETLLTNFGAGHGFAKQSATGIQTDDTKDFVMGTRSLRLTTDGNGQAVFTRKANISPAIDFTGKFLKVWIKVDDISRINELRITITSNNFASSKNYRVYDDAIGFVDLRSNQWNEITLPLGNSERGTPDISKVNSIQIRVADKATGAVSAWFNGLALVELSDSEDMPMSDHTVSWKGQDALVSSSADIDVKVNDEKLYIDKTTNNWEEPLLLKLPKAMVPQEPIVIAEEKVLPTMSWLDPESKSWVVYVDPPYSAESVHVVPEFDITLLVLALTFGFLLSVRIFRNKGLLRQLKL
ncbi:MAG: peptidoglycan/xylan/chitin deacetylase (PgdA/CDA1 family) [Candidatus Nitrosomirales archaeon]|jgi:peptidoglycan/xylan/chitin deacetylase (PgdA/CDA1 family)